MNNDESGKSGEEKAQDKKGDVRIPGKPPSIKEMIEEEARKPEKKVGSHTKILTIKEESRYKRAKLTTIVLILLFFLMIVLGYFLDPIFYVFDLLIFPLLLIGISSLITRKYFNKYFISYYLSDQYKFYLNKLAQLLKKYNDIPEPHKDYRKPHAKKIRYCIMELCSLTTSWDNPPEDKTSDIYMNLFTHDLDKFNFKLKILLLRLNGLIFKLESVPSNVIDNLERLLNYLDEDSHKLTQEHLDCINQSIKYLEENHPTVYKLEFYEQRISKAVRKFWSKRRKEVIILSFMFILSVIYWVGVTLIDLGLDNNTKFMFWGIIIMAPGITALFIQIASGWLSVQ